MEHVTRNDPCQILPADGNSWVKAFLENVDDVATWTNSTKTKVLIISQQLDVERNSVENELKINEKTSKIIFNYYEMRDPKGTVHDQESFIHMFEEIGPTLVVLAYQQGDANNKLNPKRSGYAPPGSVAEILNSKKYFSKILLSHSNYLFLRTSNVWHREECILTSLSPITKTGVQGQLVEARRSGLLDNSPDSRVVIISGGHGYREKEGRVTRAGGVSCFTNKDLLKLKFYEEDVETIRELGKDPNFDKVCFEVVNIEDYGIYKFKPKPSKLNRLSKLLSSTFCLDTSSSNTNSMHRQSSAGKLVSYLTEFRPTFILISWCFSTNGDLAMALRSQGFFSKLLMEHDLRNITKDPEARLSDQQVEVLREAATMDPSGKKSKYKNFHLLGNSGCGKTILELEIGKIMLAQICQDLKPGDNVNVCIIFPSELKKKLEDDLSFKDLVSAYPINQKIVPLQYCDSIQQLSQRIKDEISEMPPAKYTVIIADEVTIQAEEVNGELVQDFTSLDRMEDNVWCVYAHSPVDESNQPMITSEEISFKVKLPLRTDVYSQHLHTRYRNNTEILQFLKFYVSENQDRTLVLDNDHDGTRLPPGLPGSQHRPVLWLDCNWSWDDMDTLLTREMVNSLVPDMEVFNPNKNALVGVMVVPTGSVINEETNQNWRWVNWNECAGMEEEIVVIVTGCLRFESLSRARNQLIIVTGTELVEESRTFLIEAEGKNLLEKIVINDKPDAIAGLETSQQFFRLCLQYLLLPGSQPLPIHPMQAGKYGYTLPLMPLALIEGGGASLKQTDSPTL